MALVFLTTADRLISACFSSGTSCCLMPDVFLTCLFRWNVGDASIFSVDDGKRLAQTPHKPLTFYERIRLEKQQKASLESPLVQGYRLLPEFTPGRAMFWGTVLAMWGTAAIVMSTAKSLDIHTVRPVNPCLLLLHACCCCCCC